MLILAAVVGLMAVVLFVPVVIEVSLAVMGQKPGMHLETRVRFLGIGGVVDLGRRSGRTARQPARPKDRPARRYGGLARPLQRVVRSPTALRRAARLVIDLARLAKPEDVRINARIGFEDPAETGMMFGCWSAARLVCAGCCQVEPDFTAETLEARGRIRWRRSLASLLRPIVAFATSRELWRALRAR